MSSVVVHQCVGMARCAGPLPGSVQGPGRVYVPFVEGPLQYMGWMWLWGMCLASGVVSCFNTFRVQAREVFCSSLYDCCVCVPVKLPTLMVVCHVRCLMCSSPAAPAHAGLLLLAAVCTPLTVVCVWYMLQCCLVYVLRGFLGPTQARCGSR